MSVLFKLIKDIHTRSLQSAKVQNELAADMKSIKCGQKNIEAKIIAVQKRLDDLEQKSEVLEKVNEELSEVHASVNNLEARNFSLQTRLDDLEDRSRRNNLLFYGFPDCKETWQETEAKLTSEIKSVLSTFTGSTIERAHRLGSFSPTKCRPIIVKLTDFKSKEQLFSLRGQLKQRNIGVSEDFSATTRLARKKLTEFRNNQPNAASFKLRYNKMLGNGKCYIYNTNLGIVEESQSQASYTGHARHQPTNSSQ